VKWLGYLRVPELEGAELVVEPRLTDSTAQRFNH
jgi:hypothetical protein